MPRFFDLSNQTKRATALITIYGNVLTLTGTSGTANISINGIPNTLISTFATDLTTTAANWIAGNFEYYRVRGYLVSAAAGVITVLPAWGWDSVNRIKVTIVNATTDLAGTLTGTFEPDLTKAKIWKVIFGQSITIKRPRGMVESDLIVMHLKATGAYTTTWAVDGFFFPGGTENVQTSTSIDLVQGTVDMTLFPRRDTVTISGTNGTGNITAGGVTKLATFNTDLTTTASDFVTANAAAYAAVGITLTSAAAVLTFTAINTPTWNLKSLYYPLPLFTPVTLTLAGVVASVPVGRVFVEAAAKNIIQ